MNQGKCNRCTRTGHDMDRVVQDMEHCGAGYRTEHGGLGKLGGAGYGTGWCGVWNRVVPDTKEGGAEYGTDRCRIWYRSVQNIVQGGTGYGTGWYRICIDQGSSRYGTR